MVEHLKCLQAYSPVLFEASMFVLENQSVLDVDPGMLFAKSPYWRAHQLNPFASIWLTFLCDRTLMVVKRCQQKTATPLKLGTFKTLRWHP